MVCSICLEEDNNDELFTSECCNHKQYFHKDCYKIFVKGTYKISNILNPININIQCPVCRNNIKCKSYRKPINMNFVYADLILYIIVNLLFIYHILFNFVDIRQINYITNIKNYNDIKQIKIYTGMLIWSSVYIYNFITFLINEQFIDNYNLTYKHLTSKLRIGMLYDFILDVCLTYFISYNSYLPTYIKNASKSISFYINAIIMSLMIYYNIKINWRNCNFFEYMNRYFYDTKISYIIHNTIWTISICFIILLNMFCGMATFGWYNYYTKLSSFGSNGIIIFVIIESMILYNACQTALDKELIVENKFNHLQKSKSMEILYICLLPMSFIFKIIGYNQILTIILLIRIIIVIPIMVGVYLYYLKLVYNCSKQRLFKNISINDIDILPEKHKLC